MAALPHTGFVYYCPVVQSAPPHLRLKAAGIAANKCVGKVVTALLCWVFGFMDC
jgi:hypothetical protein